MKRYYELNENGQIKASYARQQPDKELLYLDEPENNYSMWDGSAWVDDPDRVKGNYKVKLDETDAGMIRVIDDLFSVLIDKNVLSENDFPKEVKDKINERKALRDKIK